MKLFDEKVLNFFVSNFYSRYRGKIGHISLDITNSCNLNCTICSLKRWKPLELNETISDDVLNQILKILPNLSSLSLQCNCEPLLNKDTVSIINKFEQCNPDLYISLVTNGTLLTSSTISELLQTNINKIAISVDGACAKTFESIRIGAKFEKVIASIRELVNQRKELHRKIPQIEIITVATKENINELVSILELGQVLGIDAMSINGLEPYSDKMESLILYDNSSLQQYKKIFSKLKSLSKKTGIQLKVPSLKIKPYTNCFIQGCAIDTNGNVYPCPSLSYRRPYYYFGKKKYHPRISFGSLKETDFETIWNSTEFTKFRYNLQKGNLPVYCTNCLIRNKVICP